VDKKRITGTFTEQTENWNNTEALKYLTDTYREDNLPPVFSDSLSLLWAEEIHILRKFLPRRHLVAYANFVVALRPGICKMRTEKGNARRDPMKRPTIKSTLETLGLPWVSILLVAAMATFIYVGPALWQTWTHTGPTLVTNGGGTGDGFVAGHDFVAFYSASRAVVEGNAALVYDDNFMKAAQHNLVGNASVGFLAFMYPPTYLLLVSPLALVPYFPALALWLLVPLLFLLFTIGRRIDIPPVSLLLVVTAPALGQALFAGQNGLLFAALLAGGLLLQDRKPILAGILLGLATAKPQLAVLLFPALIFGRQWTVLLGATATLVAMVVLSALFFGAETWSAYAAIPGQAREWLAAGQLPWHRMPTLYAAARLAGLGDQAASLAQAAIGLAVLATVAWVWWRTASVELRAAVLLAGAPLTTPFLYDYDLPFMLTALAIFIALASKTGWRSWEKPLLLAVWLQPAWWWTLTAIQWEISIAPLVYGLFFLAVTRRAVLADDHGRIGIGNKTEDAAIP